MGVTFLSKAVRFFYPRLVGRTVRRAMRCSGKGMSHAGESRVALTGALALVPVGVPGQASSPSAIQDVSDRKEQSL